MKNSWHGIPLVKKTRALSLAVLAAAWIVVPGMALLAVGEAAAIDIPPAAVKKSVILKLDNADAARQFTARCGHCHGLPDPAKPDWVQSGCRENVSGSDLAAEEKYATDVRTGKGPYESHCGRCHDLIDPGAHTAD